MDLGVNIILLTNRFSGIVFVAGLTGRLIVGGSDTSNTVGDEELGCKDGCKVGEEGDVGDKELGGNDGCSVGKDVSGTEGDFDGSSVGVRVILLAVVHSGNGISSHRSCVKQT